jgi:hypothetical protein
MILLHDDWRSGGANRVHPGRHHKGMTFGAKTWARAAHLTARPFAE